MFAVRTLQVPNSDMTLTFCQYPDNARQHLVTDLTLMWSAAVGYHLHIPYLDLYTQTMRSLALQWVSSPIPFLYYVGSYI